MYATLADYGVFYPYTAEEQEMIEVLLNQASAKINLLAKKYHFDIETAITDEDYLAVVKSVCINATHRAVENVLDNKTPSTITGYTQSALGYSVSTTYSNKSQTLYITRSELKDLGFLTQRIGAIDMAQLITQ